MLKKCIHGGADDCSRQGGDGSLYHGEGYVHPFPTVKEDGEPFGHFSYDSDRESKDYTLKGLEISFDEDQSSAILSLEVSKGINVGDLIKSLYEFDFDSEDGVLKLLEMLPILDPDIIVKLVEKIWPGYVIAEQDPDLLRAELRGFLLDYLGEDE